MADDGFLVVDTNYSLLGPDPVPDPFPCLAPRGDGYYPNNINEIAELIKFLAIEGYATGPNQATWQTMQRYVATYGLFVTGTSAGGQLSVAGAFAAASTTGYWPRGMLNVVGPMNLQDSPSNPLTPEAIALVDNYCQSSPANIAGASPYLQRTNYTSYPNWDKLSDPLEYQTKTWIGNWYNTNDNLVPQTAIVRIREARFAIIRVGPETFRRVQVKGYDLNSKTFAITEGVEPGWQILAEGAVLLNDRFAKQED